MPRLIKDAADLRELTETVLHGLIAYEGLEPTAALQVLVYACASLITNTPKHQHMASVDKTCAVLRKCVLESKTEVTVTFLRPEKAR